jgi:hypothetical protein
VLRHASAACVCACIGLLSLLPAAGCREVVIEPLILEGNLLTVNNRSSRDWTDVDVSLNQYFHVTTASILAGGRTQVPLDAFVGGFGRRFDFHHMQITDLRLTAKLPDGSPLELKKQFTVGGLAGALGGKR